MKASVVLAALAAAAASPVLAQQSASFTLVEHVFNSGGAPLQGTELSSARFRVTLAIVGDGLAASDLTSASFLAEVSLIPSNAPPGEVTDLIFTDATTLAWSSEPSVGHYNLYRDLASALSGLGYGACLDPQVPFPTAADAGFPPPGAIYFYLVTAENRLGEEGAKGYSSAGVQQSGTGCP